MVDAATALEIPDPGLANTRSCSAWRNTDSSTSHPGARFTIKLGLGKMRVRTAAPIVLKVRPTRVPVDWTQRARVRELENALRFTGVTSKVPLYLLPELYETLPLAPLQTKVTIARGGTVKEGASGEWHLAPQGRDEDTAFEVSGTMPASARKGDIVLVNVTASYPEFDNRAARSVQFLQVIHVT